MKKSIMSALLSFVLTVSIIPTVAHAMSFPDVDSNSDYAAAIEYVSELGIMVGDSQGNFNPDQIVSRCEMATIVCRMLGITESLPKSNVFDDVPAAHWANAYVGKAAELGIVGGYGNGKFGPSDPVLFEQAITMIIRAIGQGDSAERLGGYPNGFIQVAEESSLLEGIQTEKGQGLSRGAVATLLYNHYLWMPEKPNDGHTHTYEKKGTLSLCVTCGRIEPSAPSGGHTHNYIEQIVPGSGTGGHYEEVQVQVGTKTVEDRKSVTTYHCGVCDLTSTDWNVLLRHVDARYAESKPENGGHGGSRTWSETKKVVVGTHEEPVYGTRTIWVEDSATTIRVCSICGQQEPQ